MGSDRYRVSLLRGPAPKPPDGLRGALRAIGDGFDWRCDNTVDPAAWAAWRSGWARDTVIGELPTVLAELHAVYDAALAESMVPGLLPRLLDPPQVFPPETTAVLRAELGMLSRLRAGVAVEQLHAAARDAEHSGTSLVVAVDRSG